MKLLVVLSVIFVAVNGFHTQLSERQGRIASGQPLPKGRFLDFCSLTISFFQKQKTCGCFVYTPNYVVTTARCVIDCSEGLATNVTVTVAGKPYQYEKIITPPSDIYDPTDDTLASIAPFNLAAVKLAAPLKVDDKTISPSTIERNLPEFFAVLPSLPPDIILRYWACGVGITNNQRVLPKGPMCTQVNVLPPSQCLSLHTGEPFDPAPIDGQQFCVQWPNRDNNICAGDFGGPIYAEVQLIAPPGEKPPPPEIWNLGIAVGSPDIRPNAPCQDGHTVFAQQYNEAVIGWAQVALGLVRPPTKSGNESPWKKFITNKKN